MRKWKSSKKTTRDSVKEFILKRDQEGHKNPYEKAKEIERLPDSWFLVNLEKEEFFNLVFLQMEKGWTDPISHP